MTSFLCRQELGGDGDRGDPGKIVQCASWKLYSFSRVGGILVGVNRLVAVLHSLRSRRLEVVGERENGRARDTREGSLSPRVNLVPRVLSYPRERSYASVTIPAAPPPPPPPPPPADPRALAFSFFCLEWQIPGRGVS